MKAVRINGGGWLITLAVVVAMSGNVGFAGPVAPNSKIRNGGFENPKNEEGAAPYEWLMVTDKAESIGIATNISHAGKQCVRIKARGKAKAYQAVLQRIDVKPKTKYSVIVYARNCKKMPLKSGVGAQLVVEWRDGADKEVGREWTKRWDRSLPRSSWRKFQLKNLRPPKGTVQAIVGVHAFEGVHGGKGAFYIDDLQMSAK